LSVSPTVKDTGAAPLVVKYVTHKAAVFVGEPLIEPAAALSAPLVVPVALDHHAQLLGNAVLVRLPSAQVVFTNRLAREFCAKTSKIRTIKPQNVPQLLMSVAVRARE
jgi:hypothetical protein